jgi:nitrogen regulatory protein P-II 2
MPTTTLKLVTLVAEPVLESKLVHDLTALGATGWTITEGRGSGSSQRHATDFPGENIRLETIVAPAVAERIVQHMASHYFADYSLICFVSDVAVVRGEKYLAASAPSA